MEQPIRWSRALDKVPVPSIVAGLLVSAILAAFVIPVALRQYGPFRATDAVNVDWRAAKNDWPSLPDCLGRPLDVCTVVHGTKGRVLLLGDSYAHMWAPALEEIARKESLTLSVAVLDACPWQRGLTYTSANLNGFFTPFDKACKQTQADWYDRVLPQFKPDLVVVGQPVLDDPKFRLPLQFPDGRTLAFGQPGYGAEVVAVTKPSLTALQARAKLVVLKGTPSSFPYNPLDCLSTGTSPGRCAYKADTAPTTLDKFYSAYHAPDRFWNVNLDRVVCPRYPVCDAVVNHRIVRFDANGHLTATFARSVAPEVEAIFRKDGVLRSLDGG